MTFLPQEIAEYFQKHGPFIRVTIIQAQGSTPREAGAAMNVSASTISGTIGGGALEFDAIDHARSLLDKDSAARWLRDAKAYPLGPSLGQCCGGHMRLLFEYIGEEEAELISRHDSSDCGYWARPVRTGLAPQYLVDGSASRLLPGPDYEKFKSAVREEKSGCALIKVDDEGSWFLESTHENKLSIYLYGAGHVAREVVRVFEGLPAQIVWIDTDETRFPTEMPPNVNRIIAVSPHEAANYAPSEAFHVVMSYSHPIDLDICHAVLKRGDFRFLGLIGSKTKKARFHKRLRELGVEEETLSRLTCPIGAGGPTGKAPAVIAISVAAEILRLAETA